MQANNYWSSSTNASNTNNAWVVNFNNGNVNANNKNNNNYVWPVRLESDSEVNAKSSQWNIFVAEFISAIFKVSPE
ncbi:MAG: DUF1566 domain-containing protein [Burkholderiales bacterium]|nr:DUF1566 domain-containing protein [Burkholderiales bacterium]MBP9769248.1 DUF1566 domain-containing protein [Burkholderiales bacterium]